MQPATRTPNWLDLHGTVITVCVALAAVSIQLMPGGAGWLQFDRLAILDGQWWRMLTGHLTHWDLEHLGWDLLMFVVIGAMVERLSRPRFVVLCLVSAISISLMVLLGQPELRTYRGLSGIDTALFVYLACVQLASAWQQRRWGQGLLPAVLLAGFGGKLMYELVTGKTLFVDSQAAGFVVVAIAHAVGAAAGAVLGVALAQRNPAVLPATAGAASGSPQVEVLRLASRGGADREGRRRIVLRRDHFPDVVDDGAVRVPLVHLAPADDFHGGDLDAFFPRWHFNRVGAVLDHPPR